MPLLDPVLPAEARLPECARELLAALYPTVRWRYVTFHAELPPSLRRFTDVAITLPDPLAVRHIRIFAAKKHWNPCTVDGLALLVHEAYHVLQYQDALGGAGLGPLRVFPVKYLTAALLFGEGGAKKNRYEKPAYEHDARFRKQCRDLAICDCRAGAPVLDRAALAELLRRDPGLVKRSTRG